MNRECEADGTLILEDPVELPQLLDVLIVGGGPAGTATAFRAKEIGLAALVIDIDDLLKRIRDYPKEKFILPTFGGGDKMAFPAGGHCVTRLHFEPIDKDDICADWKDLYRTLSIPAKLSLELTGLERDEDGVWHAAVFNHRTRERESYLARHVVLGLGRGVPRRFDIPGNTDGVAYRLDDPLRYVEGPVCVMGGGTSAAEAVIAISNAKTEAQDESLVYWSYRGSKMPRVSKALSDVFFEAYVGNGNIRYHPHSEPVAIVKGPERVEYVSVRIDRKAVPGRPQETTHLEFLKTRCVACIGEDIPEAFLKELGIDMVTAGPKGKKMMVVTPLLETHQPNVYLVGDLLSQAYLETDDFDASPDAYRTVKHRGNIKSSLRDGVFIAEVIKQRLEGREKIEVMIVDADQPEVEEAHDETARQASPGPPDPEGPPRETIQGVSGAEAAAYLVRVTPGGVDGEEFSLRPEGITTIGRRGCDLSFPQDTLVSESHASIAHRDGQYYLRDDGSKTGTFLKLRPGKALRVGADDLIRLGRQILLVGVEDGSWHLRHFDAEGRRRGTHPLKEGTVVLGRSGGPSDPDVALDDEDLTLSRFHMSVTVRDGAVTIEDFSSRNGSFLKVDDARTLEHNDLFRLGAQLFRVNLQEELPEKTGSFPVPRVDEKMSAEPAPEAPPARAAGVEARVTFAGQDISASIDESESILDVADAQGVVLDYECWVGMCGCDLIRVLEGHQHCNEPDEQEIKTLKRKGVEPGEYRLACKTKVSGPVVVEVAG